MIGLMQQCICAIELIGSDIFSADREVDALRRVRDEMLATTDAGREWISLFERVQTPLLGALMGDEMLLEEARELLKRAAAVTRDDAEALTDQDVDRGIRVVRALGKKPEGADVRRDLRAVKGKLESFRSQQMQSAVERLMSEKPHARKSAAKKSAAKKGPRRRRLQRSGQPSRRRSRKST